jgi:hypothetical protein
MRSLDYHAHSMWLQDAVQTVRYFRSHFFLNLKTFRVDIDEACKLRNSNDSIPGQIANVNASDDRRHVVLAVGFKSDISQQHDFVVPTHLFEGSVQVLSWVLKIRQTTPHRRAQRGRECPPILRDPGYRLTNVSMCELHPPPLRAGVAAGTLRCLDPSAFSKDD